MSILTIVGIILGFLAIPVMMRTASLQRFQFVMLLFFAHLAATQLYFLYTKSNYADSYSYYYYDYYFSPLPWSELGTVFVGHVTQYLKHGLGATYYDCFMLFQAFGFWGIIILLRTFQEIAQRTQSEESSVPLYFLILPSIQFWTSAVGKDAPVFFSIALCTWATLSPARRIVPFGIGVALLLLCRAHVALVLGLALTVAFIFEKRITTGQKIFLVALSTIGLVFLVASVRDTFSVDVTSVDSVSAFMQGRDIAEASDTAGSSLGSGFAVRLVSLLFRPFFFDSRNAFGIVASIENIGSIVLFGYIMLHLRKISYLAKRVLFIRYCLVFTFLTIIMLSLVNYNVGLGLRERVMVYPTLFSIFAATFALRRRAEGSPPRKTLPVHVPVGRSTEVIRPPSLS